jgi:hypothetical protein
MSELINAFNTLDKEVQIAMVLGTVLIVCISILAIFGD